MSKIEGPDTDFVTNGWVDGIYNQGRLAVVEELIDGEVHGHCVKVAAGLTVGEAVRISRVQGGQCEVATPSRVWTVDNNSG